MSTAIEWTQRPGTKGETWNPVVGCTKVSAGCKNCYAKRIHDNRHKAYTEGKLQRTPQYASPFEAVQLMHERVALPLSWKKPRTIFVNSVSDLFHPDVPFDFIDRVFAIMALTPQHTYQVLTKRPERMAEYTAERVGGMRGIARAAAQLGGVLDEERFDFHRPLPNVWLGTSVENQATANERIPHLLRCPAAIRFLSCEPLLGPVSINDAVKCTACGHIDFKLETAYCSRCKVRRYDPGEFTHVINPGIHWVITGGESGPQARPMHPFWALSLRDQCEAAGVPFFFKQWGQWAAIDQPSSQEDIAPLGHGEQWLNHAGGQGFHGKEVWRMRFVGKHASGNLLAGTTHTAFPLSTHHSPLATP